MHQQDDPESTATEDDFDAHAYFEQSFRRHSDDLGTANIAVLGQTGVGKSTLLNAVFGSDLAASGVGRPITRSIREHAHPQLPITLFDTPGVELGRDFAEVREDWSTFLEARRTEDPSRHIHVLWYCLSSPSQRFADFERDLLAELSERVPTILVLTQVMDPEAPDLSALIDAVRGAGLHVSHVATLARPVTVGHQTIASHGLERLIESTAAVMDEAAMRAFLSAQRVAVATKGAIARGIVRAYAMRSGDLMDRDPTQSVKDLSKLQLEMLAEVCTTFGVTVSYLTRQALVYSSTGAAQGAAAATRWLAALAKRQLGIDLGGPVQSGGNYAVTRALGEAFVLVCEEAARRELDGRPMTSDEIERAFKDKLKRLPRKTGDTQEGSE